MSNGDMNICSASSRVAALELYCKTCGKTNQEMQNCGNTSTCPTGLGEGGGGAQHINNVSIKLALKDLICTWSSAVSIQESQFSFSTFQCFGFWKITFFFSFIPGSTKLKLTSFSNSYFQVADKRDRQSAHTDQLYSLVKIQ